MKFKLHIYSRLRTIKECNKIKFLSIPIWVTNEEEDWKTNIYRKLKNKR